VHKDLQAEYRTKELLSSMLLFAFLTVVIMSFAFNPTKDVVKQVFPGMIWVVFAFAGVLGLNRSFLTEKSNDCIAGLTLAANDNSAILVGKLVSNLIFMLVVELVSLPIFFVLFNFRSKGSLGLLIAVVVLGTVGFVAIGTFLAALTVQTKNSEVLLPIILFPLLVPLLIAAVQATGAILSGQGFNEWSLWLKLILGFDFMYLVVPTLLFEYLLEV
jgi:heme exporter protein B